MYALRLRVGDELFFEILRTYFNLFGGNSAGSDGFIAISEEVSNENLDDFFTSWLKDPIMPDIPELKLYKQDYR